MIDNPDQVDRLIMKLKAALPLVASLTPRLAAALQEQAPGLEMPERCSVTKIDYAGDEGGIICWLDLRGPDGKRVFLVSITHLLFDRRLPLAREIAVYQKHRIKRIRRADAWLSAA